MDDVMDFDLLLIIQMMTVSIIIWMHYGAKFMPQGLTASGYFN